MSGVVDPDLALPVRHEKLARRVAELVTAELAPGMIPGILAPGPLTPIWDWIAAYGGRQSWYINPAPFGPYVIEPHLTADARTRSLELQLACNGGQRLWSGTLREL